MPQIANSSAEECTCKDEVKVYNEEGEEEDETKRSSENLSIDKVDLVTEGEDQKRLSISDLFRPTYDSMFGVPFPDYFFPPYPGSYTSAFSQDSLSSKVPFMPPSPGSFGFMPFAMRDAIGSCGLGFPAGYPFAAAARNGFMFGPHISALCSENLASMWAANSAAAVAASGQAASFAPLLNPFMSPSVVAPASHSSSTNTAQSHCTTNDTSTIESNSSSNQQQHQQISHHRQSPSISSILSSSNSPSVRSISKTHDNNSIYNSNLKSSTNNNNSSVATNSSNSVNNSTNSSHHKSKSHQDKSKEQISDFNSNNILFVPSPLRPTPINLSNYSSLSSSNSSSLNKSSSVSRDAINNNNNIDNKRNHNNNSSKNNNSSTSNTTSSSSSSSNNNNNNNQDTTSMLYTTSLLNTIDSISSSLSLSSSTASKHDNNNTITCDNSTYATTLNNNNNNTSSITTSSTDNTTKNCHSNLNNNKCNNVSNSCHSNCSLTDNYKSDLIDSRYCKSNHHKDSQRPHIKKPLNAFMLFMKEMRQKVQEECTLKESAAINQILGKKWHTLSKEEQSKYYEIAKKEKQLHIQLFPEWSARDNYAIHSKHKKRRRLGQGNGTDGSDSKLNDANSMKKCRARYGIEQMSQWCKPCRRKKKCIRFLKIEENSTAAATANTTTSNITPGDCIITTANSDCNSKTNSSISNSNVSTVNHLMHHHNNHQHHHNSANHHSFCHISDNLSDQAPSPQGPFLSDSEGLTSSILQNFDNIHPHHLSSLLLSPTSDKLSSSASTTGSYSNHFKPQIIDASPEPQNMSSYLPSSLAGATSSSCPGITNTICAPPSSSSNNLIPSPSSAFSALLKNSSSAASSITTSISCTPTNSSHTHIKSQHQMCSNNNNPSNNNKSTASTTTSSSITLLI